MKTVIYFLRVQANSLLLMFLDKANLLLVTAKADTMVAESILNTIKETATIHRYYNYKQLSLINHILISIINWFKR